MPKSNIPKPFSGRKFQGILSQPIDRPNPVSVALFSAMQGKTVPHIVELYKLCDLYVEEQVNERLNSLAKSYGIGGLSYGIGKLLGSKSPGWEKELLLKLANDFVLGFTFTQENRKKDKGRKKKAPEHELAIHVF